MDRIKAMELGRQVLAEERASPHLGPLAQDIIARIRFRLMGYSLDGEKVSWKKDATEVRDVEKTLVVDPEELRQTFDMLRAIPDRDGQRAAMATTRLNQEGWHVYLNSRDILYRVRREGWVLLAGIVDDKKIFHTVGYNYGLDTMPDIDETDEFQYLDYQTLNLPDDEKERIDRYKVAINWRTGIAENIDADVLRQCGMDVSEDQKKISMRRLGIASAIKFIISKYAKHRGCSSASPEGGRDRIMFNIGNLYDPHSNYNIELRNAASFNHNKRIFEDDYMYRKRPSHIVKRGKMGQREVIARVRWRARGDELENAIHKLERSDSKLETAGWNKNELNRAWTIMDSQISQETDAGEHTSPLRKESH